VQIHIEVVTTGRRGRRRIATFERATELAAGAGIGLAIDEVKGLLERSQAIVATEQAHEVVAANAASGDCGRNLPCKGSAGIAFRTAFRTAFGSSGSGVRGCTRSADVARGHTAAIRSIRWRWSWPNAPTLNCRTCRRAGPASCPTNERSNFLKTSCRWRRRPAHPQVRKAGEAMATAEHESGEDFFDAQTMNFPVPPRENAAHVLEAQCRLHSRGGPPVRGPQLLWRHRRPIGSPRGRLVGDRNQPPILASL
jgi:hypothetical protein